MSSKSGRSKRKRIRDGNSWTKKDNSIKKGSEMKKNASPGFNGTSDANHGFVGTSNDEDIIVPAQLCTQGDKIMVIGSLTHKQLEQISEAAYYEDQEGYQRRFTEKRSEAFQDFLLKGGISPPNIVLNDRGGKSTEFIPIKKNSIQGNLRFKKGKKVGIVDGQTRVKGLVDAGNNGLKGVFQISFSLMSLKNEIGEASQFCTINDKQAAVKKSHLAAVYDLITQQGGEDELSDEQIKRGIISDALRQLHLDESSPFYDIFKLPDEYPYTNQQKKDFPIYGHRRWVSQESVISSLVKGAYNWLNNRHFVPDNDTKYRADYLAQILKNYYSAIKDIIPDAFNYGRNYVVLKGAGVYILTGLLTKFLEYMKIKDMSFSKRNFAKLLSKCDLLHEKEKWMGSNKNLKQKAGWIVKNHANQAAYKPLVVKIYNYTMRNIEEEKLV